MNGHLYLRAIVQASELTCIVCELNLVERLPEDTGPYALRCAVTGSDVWGTGLSLDHIFEALDCLRRERAGDPNAWHHFGDGRYAVEMRRD